MRICLNNLDSLYSNLKITSKVKLVKKLKLKIPKDKMEEEEEIDKNSENSEQEEDNFPSSEEDDKISM